MSDMLDQFLEWTREMNGQNLDPAVDAAIEQLRLLVPIVPPELKMFNIISEKDGYFAGIEVAPSEELARANAWIQFTTRERPFEDGEPTWRHYHENADELGVEELGSGHSVYGADGEGHLELY